MTKSSIPPIVLSAVELVMRIVVNGLTIIDLIIYHTLVVTRNARKLYSLLIRGTRTWIIMLGRLMIFTCVLGIGWYRLLKYFFFSPMILRNVEYGQGGKFRNLMDIYLPAPHNPTLNKSTSSTAASKPTGTAADSRTNSVPVVIFVSGGAWIIGYKLWSALVARGLSHLGVVCIVPDYRNFPQGDIEDMMADIRAAVEWTTYNASRFGGDADKIVLAGQSAGAHICTCLMVDDFLKRTNRGEYYGTTQPPSPPPLTGNTVLNLEGSSTVLSDTSATLPVTSSSTSAASSSSTSPKSPPLAPPPPLNTESSDSLVGLNIVNPPLTVEVHVDQCGDDINKNSRTRKEEENGVLQIPVSTTETVALSSSPPPTPEIHEQQDSGLLDSHFIASDHIMLFIGVSGPYNLHALVAHLKGRGLDPSILKYICRGDVLKYSPTIQLHEYCVAMASAAADTARLAAEERAKEIKLRSQSSTGGGVLNRLVSLVDDLSDLIDTSGGFGTNSDKNNQSSAETGANASASMNDVFRDVHTPAPETTESDSDIDSPVDAVESVDGLFVDGDNEEDEDSPDAVATKPRLTEVALQRVSGRFKANDSVFTPPPPVEGEGESVQDNTPRQQESKRPFYAYYLPHVHSFFADVESNTIAQTANKPAGTSGQPFPLSRHPLGTVPGMGQGDGMSTVAIGAQSVDDRQSATQPVDYLSSFPPVVLFHGSRDKSIPMSNCSDLFDTLRVNGAVVDMKIYNHWSHTDAIVEAPLSGNMRLFYDMVDCIETHTSTVVDGSDDGTAAVDAYGHGEEQEEHFTERVAEDVKEHCSSDPTVGSSSKDTNIHSSMPSLTPHKSGRARRDSAELFYDEGTTRSGGARNLDHNRKKLDIMVPRTLVNIARKINPF